MAAYVIPIDPHELAQRFGNPLDAAPDPWGDDEDEEEEGPVLDDDGNPIDMEALNEFISAIEDYETRIIPLLDRIPEREADLIYLYFVHQKKQADIAAIFGVTQAAISYRLDRGIKRIKFLLSIPQVTEEDLRRDLAEVFPSRVGCPRPGCKKHDDCPVCKGEGGIRVDVEILVGMWVTTCQSEVANRLSLTQGRVRHRFFKAVDSLVEAADDNEKYRPYEQIFSAIRLKKFNILREVKLPQWSGRGGDECF
jgi:hypothetical protein